MIQVLNDFRVITAVEVWLNHVRIACRQAAFWFLLD